MIFIFTAVEAVFFFYLKPFDALDQQEYNEIRNTTFCGYQKVETQYMEWRRKNV